MAHAQAEDSSNRMKTGHDLADAQNAKPGPGLFFPWHLGFGLRLRASGVPRRQRPHARVRAGFTLSEMMMVCLLIAILVSFSMPVIRRSIEQALVDNAAADLKGLWTAERLYWLKYGMYVESLDVLRQEHFFTQQPMYNSNFIGFTYVIGSVTSNAFVAQATPLDPIRWSGGLSIAQDGLVTGSIQSSDGHSILPSTESRRP